MGANPKQALGVLAFFLAFVLVAAGLAAGSIMWILFGVVVLVVSCAVFINCKPMEQRED